MSFEKLVWVPTLGKDVKAIAVWPFILISRKYKFDFYDLNHERIHLRQQLETFLGPGYLFYYILNVFYSIKYSNRKNAREKNWFEREAYANEKNLLYLKTRKPYAFLDYRRCPSLNQEDSLA